MVKKRKGARPVKRAKPARSVRKKTASRAEPPKRMAEEVFSGLIDPNKVNLGPLKQLMRDHIARLAAAKDPGKVENALRILREAESALRGECSPTMVIPTS